MIRKWLARTSEKKSSWQNRANPAMAAAQPAGTKITKEQATKVALEQVPGKVTDVTIERKRGKNVYVVEIQSPDQGEKDVLVDMVSGKVVGTE